MKMKKNMICAVIGASMVFSVGSVSAADRALTNFLKATASSLSLGAKAQILNQICRPHLELIKQVKVSVTQNMVTGAGLIDDTKAGDNAVMIKTIGDDLNLNGAFNTANVALIYSDYNGNKVVGVPVPYYACQDNTTIAKVNILTKADDDHVATGGVNQQCATDHSLGGDKHLANAGEATAVDATTCDDAPTKRCLTGANASKVSFDASTFAALATDNAFKGVVVYRADDSEYSVPFTIGSSSFSCSIPDATTYAATVSTNPKNSMCWMGNADDGYNDKLRAQSNVKTSFGNHGQGSSHWFCPGSDDVTISDSDKGNCTQANVTGRNSSTILYSQTLRAISSAGTVGYEGFDLLVPNTLIQCHPKNGDNKARCSVLFAVFSSAGLQNAAGQFRDEAPTGTTLGTIQTFDSDLLNEANFCAALLAES